jgi:hypothetical protein
MTSQNVSILNLTLRLTERVSAHTFVDHDGAPAMPGGYTYGVAMCNGEPGDAIGVDVLGTVQVVAGAPLVVGQAVGVGAGGRAVPEADGIRVGRALQAAKTEGDLVEIFLIPN